MSLLRHFLALGLLSAATALPSAGAGISAVYSATTRTLNIAGDELDNRIEISRTADGEILINNGEIAIAGSSPIPPTVADTDWIVVRAGDGNDTVLLDETLGRLPSAHLLGGSGNDLLIGGSGRDVLEGEDGDDHIEGGSGNDVIFGGLGQDDLVGGAGDDRLYGQLGNDVIQGDGSVDGAGGSDLIVWNEGDGSDTIEGGEGSDTVQVNGSNTAGDDFSSDPNGERVRLRRNNLDLFTLDIGTTETLDVNGQGGSDVIIGSTGLVGLIGLDLDGGEGNDLLIGGDGVDVLRGGAGNDVLIGGRGNDVMLGEDGDDQLVWNDDQKEPLGRDGSDLLIWNNGDGSDFMEGGEGFDTVQVNGSDTAGDDFSIDPNGERVRFQRNNLGLFTLDIGTTENLDVNARGGNDRVTGSTGLASLISLDLDGGMGNDVLTGGDGDDRIEGGGGNDTVFGGLGQDDIVGGSRDFFGDDGDDLLFGGDGADVLRGGAGNDVLIGGRGNDVLFGEAGNDWLAGSEGDDQVDGGADDDVLIGGWGNDWISGGTGQDIEVSLPPTDLVIRDGNGNGQVDPDECVELDVPVSMVAGAPLTGVAGILDSLTPGVVVVQGLASYPDLDPAGTSVNRTSFGLLTLPGLRCGEPIELRLTLRTSEGRSVPLFFTVPTGPGCTPGGGCQRSSLDVEGRLAKATERLSQILSGDVQPSLAAEPAACSGAVPVPSPGVRHQVHQFTNPGAGGPMTVLLTPACPAGAGLYAAAYLVQANPNDSCLSLLGEMGRDLDRALPNSFSFWVPAGATFQVVVHEVVPDSTCEAYTLQLFGLPRAAPQLRITHLPPGNQARLTWNAPRELYGIERASSLGPDSSFAPLDLPIRDSNGECSVVVPCEKRMGYFRLVPR